MSNTELSLLDANGNTVSPTLATTDSLVWSVDCTAWLGQVGGTVASVTTKWTNVALAGANLGQVVAGPTPTVSSPTVSLAVEGSVLSKATWRLDVIVTGSVGQTTTGSVDVTVPQ